jgi:transposase
MERSRRKEIKHHLTEEEIDELLREAEDDHHVRRLGFLKNLYHSGSIPEVADREGQSAATGGRWVGLERGRLRRTDAEFRGR